MNEFELIGHYFTSPLASRADVVLGIGDDAAILRMPDGQDLVASVDSLVAGVHFPPDLAAAAVGHRALAVNLSDLAAMGAVPAWALLALTLPVVDEKWLDDFANGFLTLARRFELELVGGNTSRGPLNITVAVHGFVPRGTALTRAGAAAGDRIYATGELGSAAAGLAARVGGRTQAMHRRLVGCFTHPQPRVACGQALRGIASAAIDVSDGFLADLGHILESSGVGAVVNVDALPISAEATAFLGRERARDAALSGGDDYELCFTVPVERMGLFEARRPRLDCQATCVGEITRERVLHCRREDGTVWRPDSTGYKHF